MTLGGIQLNAVEASLIVLIIYIYMPGAAGEGLSRGGRGGGAPTGADLLNDKIGPLFLGIYIISSFV